MNELAEILQMRLRMDLLRQSGGWYGERPKLIAAGFKQEISLLELSYSIELARIYSKR